MGNYTKYFEDSQVDSLECNIQKKKSLKPSEKITYLGYLAGYAQDAMGNILYFYINT